MKAHILDLLNEPKAVLGNWDYGKPGEQFPPWLVLSDPTSDSAIAFCEYGFGPRTPWGLVRFEGENMSIGMDSGWFFTFLDAYFESFVATRIPIWRVFKTGPVEIRAPITDESSWEHTWELVMERRKADPESRYDCGHSTIYGA